MLRQNCWLETNFVANGTFAPRRPLDQSIYKNRSTPSFFNTGTLRDGELFIHPEHRGTRVWSPGLHQAPAPVNLPLVLGNTSPTAFAAPVADGIMLQEAARPPRQSLAETPSTVFWVAV